MKDEKGNGRNRGGRPNGMGIFKKEFKCNSGTKFKEFFIGVYIF